MSSIPLQPGAGHRPTDRPNLGVFTRRSIAVLGAAALTFAGGLGVVGWAGYQVALWVAG